MCIMCVDLGMYIFCGLKRSVLIVCSSVEVAVLELFLEERENLIQLECGPWESS